MGVVAEKLSIRVGQYRRIVGCLNQISSHFSRSAGTQPPLSDLLDYLPQGFRNPSEVAARLVLNDRVYAGRAYQATPCRCAFEISSGGNHLGSIEVCRVDGDTAVEPDRYFLREEAEFIQTIAQWLGAFSAQANGFADSQRVQFEARRLRRLARVVHDLSQVRTMDAIADIVRHASRELAASDGATFVLRDGDLCHYVDEDAIEPLWKGKRFPMSACISGWVMTHGVPAVIEDIYTDDRIPHDAYRPTFVKSLVMVPVRSGSPIAAIGNYWARSYRATDDDVQILQALADSTSVAMENVRVYQELEERVRSRTSQLEAVNKELDAFSYSVSHDLRAPLRSIDGFSVALFEDCGSRLDDHGRDYVARIRAAVQRMGQLIDDLLKLSRVSAAGGLNRARIDLSELAREILSDFQNSEPERHVTFSIQENVVVFADPYLIRIVFDNLIGNAWKYTSKRDDASIEFGAESTPQETVCFVRDNGAGFNMAYSEKLFTAFQRLHTADEFAGTGIGLATVARIMNRHGGRVWADGKPGQGATFYFALPALEPSGVR